MINYSVDKSALRTQFYILCVVGLIMGLIIGSFFHHSQADIKSDNRTIVKNSLESFIGCITNGKAKYEIEMEIVINKEGEKVIPSAVTGTYRYLSKPVNARLDIYGQIDAIDDTRYRLSLFCKEGVERFDLIVEDNSTISGSWRKYNDWNDVIAGGDNYRRKLNVEMRSVDNADYNPNLYDYPQTSERLLSESDLIGKSKDEIKIMRNEILARHGYIFKNKELNEYFSSKSWYNPKSSDVTSELSEIEIKNIEFLKKHE